MVKKRPLGKLIVPKQKPKVLVIGTGGAISAKPVKGKWVYGEIPIQELISTTKRISEHFDVTATNVFRMDSSDMKPENWLTLANTIYYKMNEYDGIVVTIGTDTLAYAATAISFLIQNNNIPIVFTGSKIDSTQLKSDARINLRDAITVAGLSDIAETVIVFNGRIMRANRAKKVNASEIGAFRSFENPELGKIEQFIHLKGEYRKRSKSKPALYNKLENLVATIKIYPGFDGNRVRSLVDYPVKGLVLEGFGLGNIPLLDNELKEGIKYANKKNVPIVIASNCELGEYWQYIYEAEIGTRLKGMKVIPVYDMLPETAYVKLMWVLGQAQDFEEIKKMMQRPYCGEVSKFNSKNGKLGL